MQALLDCFRISIGIFSIVFASRFVSSFFYLLSSRAMKKCVKLCCASLSVCQSASHPLHCLLSVCQSVCMFANDAKNMQNNVYIIIYYSILFDIKSYSLLFYSIHIICNGWLLLSTFLATLANANYIFAV